MAHCLCDAFARAKLISPPQRRPQSQDQENYRRRAAIYDSRELRAVVPEENQRDEESSGGGQGGSGLGLLLNFLLRSTVIKFLHFYLYLQVCLRVIIKPDTVMTYRGFRSLSSQAIRMVMFLEHVPLNQFIVTVCEVRRQADGAVA